MRFQDKIAVITAVASGIGRASADIMASEGAIIIGIDNDKTRLDRAVAQIKAAGGRAEGRIVDALNGALVDAAVADIAGTHGRIDILLNAVGGSTIIAKPAAIVEELTLGDWQRLIQFNLDGTFNFCHAVTPIMKRQGSGKIVNISSIAGRGLSPSSSTAYAAAKGGIIAFTRKLAYELGPSGINVNAIAPSLTLSERLQPRWQQQSPDDQAAAIAQVPLRRIAEPADQARVICFLASSDADFVTGLTIDVTGGN